MNLIKKFDKYFDAIKEALNSTQDINWKENNDHELVGFFEINNFTYKIECLKQIGNNWSFSFYYLDEEEKWSSKLKNDKTNTFKVLSTIEKSIYFLYENKDPNCILFSAIDNSDTRKRLYLNFCEKFCEINNLKLSNKGNQEYQLFLLFKRDLDELQNEEIFSSVEKVVEQNK